MYIRFFSVAWIFIMTFAFGVMPPGSQCYARNLRLTHYTSDEGLSHTMVYSILCDLQGCLWIGTRDGLNVFDGYSFKTYRSIPGDTTSLSNNWILSLYEDSRGTLWVGTAHAGLHHYDRKRGAFTRYIPDLTLLHYADPQSGISAICEDNDSNLWLGTQKGALLRFNIASTSFSQIPDFTAANRISGHLPTNIDVILRDSSNVMWVATDDGLYSEAGELSSFAFYDCHSIEDSTMLIKRLNAVTLDHSGAILCAINNRLYTIDSSKFIPYDIYGRTPDLPVGETIKHISADVSAQWIITDKALYAFDNNGGNQLFTKLLHMTPTSATKFALSNAVCDNRGSFWYGTTDGLYRVDRMPEQFTTIADPQFTYKNSSDINVRAICEHSNGSLWVGCDDGFSVGTGERFLQWREPLSDMNGLVLNGAVNTIIEDRFGDVWLGYTHSCLMTTDPSLRNIRIYRADQTDSTALAGGVYSLYEDNEGIIWVGTKYGLLRFNRSTNNFTRYFETPDDGVLQTSFVFAICETENADLWVGGTSGLRKFDRISGKYTETYVHNPMDPSSLNGYSVWSILESRNSDLWIGTYEGGLNRFESADRSFTHFAAIKGMPNSVLYGILEDSYERLWCSTNKGLIRFTPASHAVRMYEKADGLQDNAFYFGAYHYNASSGRMYFGGRNGLSMFYPDSIRDGYDAPRTYITGFRVNDSLRYAELLTQDTVRLTYDENFFAFEFSALDYVHPQKRRYAYILEDVDNDWIYCGQRRYAPYTRIPSGSYTFRVKSSSYDGSWENANLTVQVIIDSPWWNSAVFRILATLGIAISVILGIRLRIDANRRKEALQRRAVESELQSLRLQMNPHFIFNALNSIQHFVLNSNSKAAYDHLAQFARLVRLILESSKCDAIPLELELQMLRMYLQLEALRFEQAFDYDIRIDKSIDVCDEYIPPLLLQPLVENAVIHGLWPKSDGGTLRITITANGADIKYGIEDNGIGRAAANAMKIRGGMQHTSTGIRAVTERLQILSDQCNRRFSIDIADIFDPAGRPSGTKVIICVPRDFMIMQQGSEL